MKNINAGYVGAQRSVRSQQAIEDFKVPLSLIKRPLIEKFLNSHASDYSKEDLGFLKTVSVAKWKYLIKERGMGYDSQHHTSCWFNMTIHYDLEEIAEALVEEQVTLDKEYKEYLSSKKKASKDFKYGVIKVAVWGGTRNRPRFKGYEEVAGIIVGHFLYYKHHHKPNSIVKKLKTNAKKVRWLKDYNSYKALVTNYKKYENSEDVFQQLISEKFKQKSR